MTGLTAGHTYYLRVYAFNGVDASDSTSGLRENYKTDAYGSGNQAAAGASNDSDSKVEAPGTQVAAGDVSSLATSAGSAVDVFAFKIRDLGTADGKATKVTQITLFPGSGNSANWASSIQGVKLYNVTDSADVTIGTPTITDSSINIPITSGNLDIPNGGSKDIRLSVYLNTANITDDSVLQFKVAQTSHGFSADNAGSAFASDFGAAVSGNSMTIRVLATKLAFTSVPSGVTVSQSFSATVQAQDANGNLDSDATTAVTITKASGSGTLTGGDAQNLASGAKTWSALQIDAGGGFTIQAAGGSLGTATSDTIAASYPPAQYQYRSYTSGNWNSTGTWEQSTDGSTWVAATATPNSDNGDITIQNGHTVTITASVTVDQVTVANGAQITLNSSVTLTVDDGTGDDIVVQSGGAFELKANPSFDTGSTAKIEGGGVVRVAASGLTGAGAGVNAANFIYGNGSILEYTLTTAFSSSGVTYFPNADVNTVPVFRVTALTSGVGATSATVVNGIMEVGSGVSISWTGAGTKTFRNGIRGAGSMSQSSAGQFIISGATAELGGGTLTLGANGLQINSASVTTMSSDKTVDTTSGTFTLAGTLDLNGKTLTGTATVSSGGILKGNGTVSGVVTVNNGGTVAPGASIGTLTLGASPSLGGTLAMEIDKAGDGTKTADKLAMGANNIAFGGALTVTKTGAGTLANGDSFTLVETSGSMSDWFTSVSLPALAGGLSWDTNKLATTGVLDIYGFSFAGMTLSTPKNTATKLSIAKLLTKATTARGTKALDSVVSPSANGGMVSSDGTYITFTPLTGSTAADSFTCVLKDGHGSIVVTVNLTITDPNAQSPNIVWFGHNAGTTTVVVAGRPGVVFGLEECADSLLTCTWTRVKKPDTTDMNETVGGTGLATFVFPSTHDTAYFRTVYVSGP